MLFPSSFSTMEDWRKFHVRNLLFFLVLLCHSFLFSLAVLDPVDFVALQAIRKALDDMPGSTFFSSWDFTSDPCNFSGVYCDSDRVIALGLGDPRAGSPGLFGHIDSAIGNLVELTEFSIVPGRVMGSLPQTLTQCRNLRFIAITKNYISGTIPLAISNLRCLQTLDLSYNLLTGSIPKTIGNIGTLSNLILCHNKLSGSIPSTFVFSSLQRIDLKHNNLSGVITPNSLPKSLRYLSLSTNRFTGTIEKFLYRLDRLNYLDLSENRFMGRIPSVIFSFPISSLQLQRNRFSGSVWPLKQVTIATVDLSYNRLSGPISPYFSSVNNLYLHHNKFTRKIPKKAFSQWSNSTA